MGREKDEALERRIAKAFEEFPADEPREAQALLNLDAKRTLFEAFLKVGGVSPHADPLARHLLFGEGSIEEAIAETPKRLIDAKLVADQGGEEFRAPFGFNALQLCVLCGLTRHAKLLLLAGANPNFFNCSVTPVGLAAYTGRASILADMVLHGADCRLHLAPEHAPGAEASHASTLLHRVANRRMPNKTSIIAILCCDHVSYPNLNPMTLRGETPMDWFEGPQEEFKALAWGIAQRELQDLKAAVEEPAEGAAKKHFGGSL